MSPVHPGEILRTEFLEPLGLSQYALSKAIWVERSNVNQIIRGNTRVTARMALRLAKYLGTSAEFWTDLQTHYDLQTLRVDSTFQAELVMIQPRTET